MVSTQKQGQSSPCLEGQQAPVLADVHTQGLTTVAQFTEIEMGTRKRRQVGGVLLIAKLDHLARDVEVANLMERSVRFTAVDTPEADHLTIHVLAAIAQREACWRHERGLGCPWAGR